MTTTWLVVGAANLDLSYQGEDFVLVPIEGCATVSLSLSGLIAALGAQYAIDLTEFRHDVREYSMRSEDPAGLGDRLFVEELTGRLRPFRRVL